MLVWRSIRRTTHVVSVAPHPQLVVAFSDEVIVDLARQGKRRILVVAPSFVADCLETIIEIEQDYKALFVEHGGEDLVMVPSLNDSPDWADAIIEIAG